MNNYSLQNQLPEGNKQIRNLNFFWIGYIIYSFSYSLIGTGYVNFKLFQFFQIIGLILIISNATRLIKNRIEDNYLRFIFTLYCGWSFLLILRGFDNLLNYDFLKGFLFDPTYGGMLYFVPLIILFPAQISFYKRVFDVIALFCVFYIIYDIVFVRDLLSAGDSNSKSLGIVEQSTDLSFPCGFILLTYLYHSNKRIIVAAAALFLTLLFATIRARRGLILMASTMVLFAYLVYFFTSKYKLTALYLSVLLVAIGAIYYVHLYKPKNNPIFSYILERGQEDTRTGVELLFYDDMKTTDWIIGRGINGEYFAPGIEEYQVTNYRDVIETGYLQTILKGGIISLALFLLIAIPAIINGLFFSKNLLSKASAIWIFWVVMSMYPAVTISFTLRYVLVWIAIGICYSKDIRNMSNDYIKEHLSTNT